ncbi:hypothetical protein [Kitasatospora albolonga]|uniref:hypothetical protein n=1 Tax=Kitasatospora albolonga TaxID=68173 RepID=UPI0031EF6420
MGAEEDARKAVEDVARSLAETITGQSVPEGQRPLIGLDPESGKPFLVPPAKPE